MSRFVNFPRTFLVLALAALVIGLAMVVTDTALAKERDTVAIRPDDGTTLPGGTGGGTTGATDGDPTDSNDFGSDNPYDDLVDPDTQLHDTYTIERDLPPTITIGGRWGMYLVFDRHLGMTIPSFRLYRLGSSGEG